VAEPLVSPFTIIVDSREQQPFLFFDIRADAKDGNRPVQVQTKVAGLAAGDYSIEGFEDRIAIERKSFEDLFSTLSHGRDRFERELERLNALQFAAVVTEASWRDIAYYQPHHSRMRSKSVVRSIFAFSVRFPRVHWFPWDNRQLAEACCYRLLERFWRDATEGKIPGPAGREVDAA
jgi:DNA excision repair protein ERCC-4